MKMFAVAAALAAVVLAGSASAATINFNVSQGWTTNAVTYGSGQNTVSVEAFRYDSRNPVRATGNPHLASWSGNDGGLGICSDLDRTFWGVKCDESHQVDGHDGNELAVLNFGARSVKLTHITFAKGYVESNDRFDLVAFANGIGAAATAAWLDRSISGCSSSGCTVNVSSLNVTGSIFGIGAWQGRSDYKIKAISYDVLPPSVVPLPAAGWGLIAGLGALAALKRRRKAA